jgi:hypothetical protein
VTEFVQREIKTLSEVLQTNCSLNSASTLTPDKLKRVVRTALSDEERPKNFLILSADEDLYCKGIEKTDKDLVDEIVSVVGVKPSVDKCGRIGTRTTNGEGRPIKVTSDMTHDTFI